MTLVMVRSLVHWPALASTRAGTPTSRNAAAVISLCLHHEAATFTNASSSSGSRSACSSRARGERHSGHPRGVLCCGVDDAYWRALAEIDGDTLELVDLLFARPEWHS